MSEALCGDLLPITRLATVSETAHVGFTGSRNGMTPLQLTALRKEMPIRGWLHHGDCVGSDKQAHGIARDIGLLIAGHPALILNLRAWCKCDVLHPPKDYLVRNHDIVDATLTLIATPDTMQEQARSGTWSTIRYARKLLRPVTIIFRNGSVRYERQPR